MKNQGRSLEALFFREKIKLAAFFSVVGACAWIMEQAILRIDAARSPFPPSHVSTVPFLITYAVPSIAMIVLMKPNRETREYFAQTGELPRNRVFTPKLMLLALCALLVITTGCIFLFERIANSRNVGVINQVLNPKIVRKDGIEKGDLTATKRTSAHALATERH
jgi:hypothetical protein